MRSCSSVYQSINQISIAPTHNNWISIPLEEKMCLLLFVGAVELFVFRSVKSVTPASFKGPDRNS